jgi:hypothetical protein
MSRTPPSTPFGDILLSDVYAARALLTLKGVPVELADIILDYAEYWAVQRFTRPETLRLSAMDRHLPSNESSALFVETGPLGADMMDANFNTHRQAQGDKGKEKAPFLQHRLPKCRKVVFTLRSRDQGWCSSASSVNTYHGSFSWFDATLLRPDSNYDGQRHSPFETLALDGQDPLGLTQAQTFSPEQRAALAINAGERPMFFLVENPESVVATLARGGWMYVPNEENDDGEVTWLVQRNKTAAKHVIEHRVVWTAESTTVAEHASHVVATAPDRSVTDLEEPAAASISTTPASLEEDSAWPADGAGNGKGFVDKIEIGDRIGLWARAKVSPKHHS